MRGSWKIMIFMGMVLVTGIPPVAIEALPPEVTNLGSIINSEGVDMGPVVTADGNFLYFTSDREGGYGGQDIWVSERVQGVWTKPENAGPPLNNNMNQGPDFYYKDEKGMEYLFITNCQRAVDVESAEGLCDIYISEKSGRKGWSKPKSLGPPINTDYSEANASWDYINRTLYFVSSRPGGMPGDHPHRRPGESSYDVWRAQLQDNGKWGEPESLGEPVNTPGWEGVAFYHAASDSLYFSSDGHGGAGGADIFRSIQTSPGVWSDPEPVEVVNTPYDDIYFSIPASGELAYFSSSTAQGLGNEDIYVVPISLIMPMPTVVVAPGPGPGHVETIYFDFDQSAVRSSEKDKLDKIVDFMDQNLSVKIEVAGHACSVGEEDYNLVLSKARADATVKYLMRQKINPNRIVVQYYGETRPAEPNDPVRGNSLNRRVEISIR